MTIQTYFKPADLKQKMDAQFAVFEQEIVEHLQQKITSQKVIEIAEVLIELSQETHTDSNFRAEVRLLPLKSTVFDEIRVVEEHKQYIPAIRHAANKAVEILMKEKGKMVK